MKDTITIFLTPLEVEQFKEYQRHYELFNKLQEHKVLDIGFGKVIINIAYGQVQNIVKEECVWKR